ncbi:MAG: hypothetical protein ACE5DN_05425 [Flavobacteriales bacterium]
MMQYIIPVLIVTALSAGWVGVQLLARKAKTKNHMDHGGGGCSCGGGSCDNREGCNKEN